MGGLTVWKMCVNGVAETHLYLVTYMYVDK